MANFFKTASTPFIAGHNKQNDLCKDIAHEWRPTLTINKYALISLTFLSTDLENKIVMFEFVICVQICVILLCTFSIADKFPRSKKMFGYVAYIHRNIQDYFSKKNIYKGSQCLKKY